MSCGSTWNKWDFHLHTPYSILNNQFGDPDDDCTWDMYVERIENEATARGIVAIGVTDYFTIEGYKRLREYQASGRLQGLMLFPNIEFRIDKVIHPSNKKLEAKRINVHVLFSPDVPPDIIEDHFLHDLVFVHESEPFDSPQVLKLKISNLEELGRSLQQQHEPFRDRSPLEIGCKTATVQVEQIKARLNDQRFWGKHLLVLAEENLSLIDWDGQDHHIRKQLIQMSHAVFTSNESSRSFLLGEKHDSFDAYLQEFKSAKPCLWGCDSHGFEERFLEPDEKRYCWIKSEVTWEGLKQVLYEPDERVRIQEDNPEPIKSRFTLEKVEVEETAINSTLAVASTKIDLNSNLITIIGGRGSGKTALLDLIASCFEAGNQLQENESSFFRRVYSGGRGKGVTENPAPVPIKIQFKSGELFSKCVGKDVDVFESSTILYLTQNHIDDYTANPDKLYSHVIELVFARNPEGYRHFEHLSKQIADIRRELQSLNLDIEHLQDATRGKLASAQQLRKHKEGERYDFENRLTQMESRQQGQVAEIERLTTELQLLKDRREHLEQVVEYLNALRQHIDQFISSYADKVQEINEQLSRIPDVPTITQLPSDVVELRTAANVAESNIILIKAHQERAVERIPQLEGELNNLEGVNQVLAQLRQQINAVSREIVDIDAQIASIRSNEEKLQQLNEQRIELYVSIMLKIIEQRSFLQEVLGHFETDRNELLQSLKFEAVVDINRGSDYIQNLCDKLDNRSHSYWEISELFTPIINEIGQLLNDLQLTEEVDGKLELTQLARRLNEEATGLRRKTRITDSDYFNTVWEPFFVIGLHIGFNDRPLQALSMGERAIVLLKIILALDDNPLLIDQPEEHLDNRYIFDELVPVFRSAKKERQIIIATHNANLVVNTDAEQVVIANHQDGQLNYTVGTLEDLAIRDSIKGILEGGDEAFKKREERYGYRF